MIRKESCFRIIKKKMNNTHSKSYRLNDAKNIVEKFKI